MGADTDSERGGGQFDDRRYRTEERWSTGALREQSAITCNVLLVATTPYTDLQDNNTDVKSFTSQTRVTEDKDDDIWTQVAS